MPLRIRDGPTKVHSCASQAPDVPGRNRALFADLFFCIFLRDRLSSGHVTVPHKRLRGTNFFYRKQLIRKHFLLACVAHQSECGVRNTHNWASHAPVVPGRNRAFFADLFFCIFLRTAFLQVM